MTSLFLRECEILAAGCVAVLLSGCAVGYNSVLFVTRTNVGVDIDSRPPTLEVGVGRQEGVFEPQFEGGKTLPVLASFRSKVMGPKRLLMGMSSAFATGRSAIAMTQFYDKPDAGDVDDIEYDGLELTKELDVRPKFLFFELPWHVPYQKPGEVSPLFFGTKTNLGLQVEWDGTAGQYPSGAHLGYKRKELAWTSVSETPNSGYGAAEFPVKVDVPSLLATVDTDVEGEDNVKFDYLQYFATGDAATNLAVQPQVREVMLRILGPDPNMKLATVGDDELGVVARYGRLNDELRDLKNSAQDIVDDESEDKVLTAAGSAWGVSAERTSTVRDLIRNTELEDIQKLRAFVAAFNGGGNDG